MVTKPLFGLTPESITEDFINEMIQGYEVPQMTTKRLELLCVLIRINGINKKNEDGEFYLTNAYLMDIAGFKSEEKLINALCWMVDMGLITRRSTYGVKPTFYKVTLKRSEKGEYQRTNKGSKKGRIPSKDKDIDAYYSAKANKDQLKEKIKKEKGSKYVAEIAKLRREVEEYKKVMIEVMQGKPFSEIVGSNAALREQLSFQSSLIELGQADGESNAGYEKCDSNLNLNEATTNPQGDSQFYKDADIHSLPSNVEVSEEKCEQAQATYNLNSDESKTDTPSEEERELKRTKLEISRLLSKFNGNTLSSSEYKRLLACKNENMLTLKQIRMLWAVSERERPIDKTCLYLWANEEWAKYIDQWVSELGDTRELDDSELCKRIQIVMRPFSNKAYIKYRLWKGDEDMWGEWVNGYLCRTMSRIEEIEKDAC